MLKELHSPPKASLLRKQAPTWRYVDVVVLLRDHGLLRTVTVPLRSEIRNDSRVTESNELVLAPPDIVHAWLAMRLNSLPPGVRPSPPTTLPPVRMQAPQPSPHPAPHAPPNHPYPSCASCPP